MLLAGHGANVVNNPHASGLHCGACGGYSGEVNARLLAALLNDPRGARRALPDGASRSRTDTLFIAALHDTTTDAVDALCGRPSLAARTDADIEQAAALACRRRRDGAGRTRAPAAAARGAQTSIAPRSRDWAEVRPEWGLAGCKAFIAAPRARTAGRASHGRAFLHDYDWRQGRRASACWN